jgi:hypothetical protein
MLLLHPTSQNSQSFGMTTLTFRKQGSTKIINYSSASGKKMDTVTYKGKHKTSATVQEGEDAVKSPVGRGLDTPMSGQIDIGYCREY